MLILSGSALVSSPARFEEPRPESAMVGDLQFRCAWCGAPTICTETYGDATWFQCWQCSRQIRERAARKK